MFDGYHCINLTTMLHNEKCLGSIFRSTFSDTAITDRHSDTTIFQYCRSRRSVVRRSVAHRLIYWIGKIFGHVPPVGVEPSTFCMQGEHPIHLARLSAYLYYIEYTPSIYCFFFFFFWPCYVITYVRRGKPAGKGLPICWSLYMGGTIVLLIRLIKSVVNID